MSKADGTNSTSLSEQAAEWVILLSDGEISHELRTDFETWLAQDSRHREAYEQVDHLWQSLTPQKRQSRKGIKLVLSIVLLLCGLHGLPLSEWLAGEHTSIGEIRRIALTDGSHITLDSDSAADIAFDTHQRRIILRRGRLLAEVTPDFSHSQRPFMVETRDGIAQALGTLYTVEQSDYDSIVNVIESRVAIASRARPHQPITLQAGQSIRLDRRQLYQPKTTSTSATSWTQARLIYQDALLDQIISDLARYQKGVLKINEQAGQLRFTGVLPADDAEAALIILKDALPIHIKQYGGWLVWIDLQK
ncbi:MAG: DUF4880 domain-containing protein [Nitrosomonas sp.]|nr:FecR domain-containing protein [Nitrosomonas sp.]TXI36478.1 MAG: DUF4880 domain-containing protein [Nitrosomonas sp.]